MPDWSQPDFEWDEGNAEHVIARHGIYPDEVEEVFYNGADVRRKGDLYFVYGQTFSRRYLFIVCELRDHVVRVATTRDMSNRESRSYARRR